MAPFFFHISGNQALEAYCEMFRQSSHLSQLIRAVKSACCVANVGGDLLAYGSFRKSTEVLLIEIFQKLYPRIVRSVQSLEEAMEPHYKDKLEKNKTSEPWVRAHVTLKNTLRAFHKNTEALRAVFVNARDHLERIDTEEYQDHLREEISYYRALSEILPSIQAQDFPRLTYIRGKIQRLLNPDSHQALNNNSGMSSSVEVVDIENHTPILPSSTRPFRSIDQGASAMQSSSSHSSSSSSSSSSSHSNSSSSAASSSLSLKLRVDLNVRKQQPWYIALDQALLEEEDWLLERDDRNAAQRALRSAWRAFQPATSLERAKEIFATIRTVIDDADCSDDYVFKYLMTLANSQLQISDDKWFIKFLKKLQGVLALSPELTALQAEERAMMIAQIDAAVEAALKRFLEKTEKGVGADSGGKENHVARRNGAGTINPGGSAMNASSSASSSAPTTGALTVVPQRNVNASSSAGATQPSTASSSAGVSQSSSSSSAQGTVASMLNAHSSLTTPHASGATSSGGSKAQPEPSASNSGTSKKFADLPTGFWAFTQQAAATAQQPKASDDQNSQNPAPILADRNPMPYVGFSFTSSSHSSS